LKAFLVVIKSRKIGIKGEKCPISSGNAIAEKIKLRKILHYSTMFVIFAVAIMEGEM